MEEKMIELNESDRRRSVRLDFVSDVIIRSQTDDKMIKGELINLGIGGLSLKTPMQMEKGAKCVTAILIRDKYSELVIKDVEGEVVRCNNEEMAIKFQHRFEWLALFHVYHSKSAAQKE